MSFSCLHFVYSVVPTSTARLLVLSSCFWSFRYVGVVLESKHAHTSKSVSTHSLQNHKVVGFEGESHGVQAAPWALRSEDAHATRTGIAVVGELCFFWYDFSYFGCFGGSQTARQCGSVMVLAPNGAPGTKTARTDRVPLPTTHRAGNHAVAERLGGIRATKLSGNVRFRGF